VKAVRGKVAGRHHRMSIVSRVWYGFTLRYALSSVLCPSQVSSRGLRGVWAWFCFLRVHVVLFRSAVSGLARLRHSASRRAARAGPASGLGSPGRAGCLWLCLWSGADRARSGVWWRPVASWRLVAAVSWRAQSRVRCMCGAFRLLTSCIAGLKSNHHFALARFFLFSITIS
jgi:hypothetical protein